MAFDRSIMRPHGVGLTATLTDAATVATDASLAQRFVCTITTGRTLGIPTNPQDGMERVWEITNSAGTTSNLALTTTGAGFAVTGEVATPIAIPTTKTAVLRAYYSAALGKWVAHNFAVTT